MLPEFVMNRKTYLIVGIVFAVFCILGFSFAYFQRATLLGNISDNTITVNTLEEGSITRSFITTYENGTMEMETGILNLTSSPYQMLKKFKVQNIYDGSQAITINWNLVTSTIDNTYSSYALYECSASNYSDSTIANVNTLCSILSPTTGNLLPNTGEKSKLQSATELSIGANSTKYYVVLMNIGVENNGKSFQANIRVKDCRSNTLTLTLNGGEMQTSTSMDVANGDSVVIPSPTKLNDAFYGWDIISGTGASVVGDVFYMGPTDVAMEAIWVRDLLTITGGSHYLLDEGHCNWKLKFLSNSTLNILSDIEIDAFLVGGGGGGDNGGIGWPGAGGGGGYAVTQLGFSLAVNSYTITIGSGGSRERTGGATSAFGISALGGIHGGVTNLKGGNGGSGGGAGGRAGGAYGNNGVSSGTQYLGGTGQYATVDKPYSGQTTCEFNEGTLAGCNAGVTAYGGGGGGAGAAGGAGGGANGGGWNGSGSSAASNTGGGGGGGGNGDVGENNAGYGGSGIVIIRNPR